MSVNKENYSTLYRNILISEELKKILQLLREEKIEVILLRGMTLAEKVYSHLGLRPMGDIDLLVHKRDLPKIAKRLRELNYQQELCGEPTFFKPINSLTIDIHKDIWYLTQKEMNKLWRETIKTEIAQSPVQILPWEDCLIYVVTHAILHHGSLNKIWLEDVKQIINIGINWDKLIRKIKEYNLQVPLFLALLKTKQIGEVKIPFLVLKELKPSGRKYMELILYQFILNNPVDEIGYLLRLLALRNFQVKSKFLVKFFFPSKEFLLCRYRLFNPNFFFLYYFFRPFFLFFKGVNLLFNLLKKIYTLFLIPHVTSTFLQYQKNKIVDR